MMKLKLYSVFLLMIYLSCENNNKENQTKPDKYERNTCVDSTKSDLNKTVLYFTNVIFNDTNDLQAYYNLGMAYYKLNNFDSALIIFDQLINKDSCFAYALTNRATIKTFLNDKEGACNDYSRAFSCEYGITDKDLRIDFQNNCK